MFPPNRGRTEYAFSGALRKTIPVFFGARGPWGPPGGPGGGPVLINFFPQPYRIGWGGIVANFTSPFSLELSPA